LYGGDNSDLTSNAPLTMWHREQLRLKGWKTWVHDNL
jgi:hypothetical protein